MKKYFLFTILLLNIANITFGILSPNPSIKQYLNEKISDYQGRQYFNSNELCRNGIEINNLFNFMEQKGYFYKDNIGYGEYFRILTDFSKNDKTNNFKTRSIFPYVNNSFLENGKGINIVCSGENVIYLAGGFETKGIIEIDTGYITYLQDSSLSFQKENPIHYSKIYLEVENKENLGAIPLNNGKLFIGCIQDIDYSNYLYYIKSNILLDRINYEVKSVHLWIYKTINGIAKPQDIKNQNIGKYKDGDEVTIRFYIDPGFVPRHISLECENPWMLKYEIIEK